MINQLKITEEFLPEIDTEQEKSAIIEAWEEYSKHNPTPICMDNPSYTFVAKGIVDKLKNLYDAESRYIEEFQGVFDPSNPDDYGMVVNGMVEELLDGYSAF